jgi:2-polyprenyl-3-methyl-5-hydroxy-6-metoxy-1,4-benzoquinol methylase
MTDPWFLSYLSVPCCGAPPTLEDNEVVCPECEARYPVEDGVIRFHTSSAYADNFGVQWAEFAGTQVDHLNGTTITRDWLEQLSGGSLDLFQSAVVYDAGAGSGRFAAVAAAHGARVIAADLSLDAIRACAKNLSAFADVICVHADARRPPVQPKSIDVALSIGVYQHTPDPRAYLRTVAEAVTPGGTLVFWGYERRLKSLLHPKYVLRPLTRRLRPRRLLTLVERTAPTLLSVSDALRRLPAGRLWARLVPVANPRGVLPLSGEERLEWAVLTTFDWLSPAFDHPLSYDDVAVELAGLGFEVTRTDASAVGCISHRIRGGHPQQAEL